MTRDGSTGLRPKRSSETFHNPDCSDAVVCLPIAFNAHPIVPTGRPRSNSYSNDLAHFHRQKTTARNSNEYPGFAYSIIAREQRLPPTIEFAPIHDIPQPPNNHSD